jgi:uncharacterized iron-regulated membrane protein
VKLRTVVLVTHRWIGLATSLVLSIVGLTGVVFFMPPSALTRASGRVHESLGLGSFGARIVFLATLCGVLLQLGGLYLWWRRKLMTIRLRSGWRRALIDLHHVAGLTGFLIMLTLAATGVVLVLVGPQDHAGLRKVAMDLHTARTYGWPIKVLYAAATSGFLIQGLTGVVMWWRPKTT